MNYNKLKYLFAVPVLGLVSCLDFDTPSDEFAETDVVLDPVVYSGDADKLDYTVEVSQDDFTAAKKALNQYFGQLISAQYYLMGGKDGNMPGEHQWQYVYNLTIDNYAGYTTGNNNLNGRQETTYSYYQDFSDGPFGRFLSMKSLLGNFLNIDHSNSIVELKAIALLLFDYAAIEVTDIYGAIPLVDHKANKESNPFEFNKGIDIYASVIANIDDAVACFENFSSRPAWYQQEINSLLGQYDMLTGTKSLETWRRFANSMKLRMAMHVVKVMPEKAKQWAEEAVASGVVDSRTDEVALNGKTNYFNAHPLRMIMNGWNDSRINASFESLLFSLDHPYTKYMLGKNSEELVNPTTGEKLAKNSRVVGIRAGIRMIAGQQFYANPRVGYSQFAGNDFEYMPVYTIKWSEVDFLRAEGALRGWNMGGTPEMFYNRGIKNADCGDLEMGDMLYDTMVDDYMAMEKPKAYKYVDPMDHTYDIESVTTIGVKWNDADDNETKLEKIITQKYIAVFPYSYEAWTELRRTGYPKIFPVLNPQLGDGSLQDGDLIRRIPLPGRATTVGLDDINTSGIPALEGPDQQATRVFWDTEAPNI